MKTKYINLLKIISFTILVFNCFHLFSQENNFYFQNNGTNNMIFDEGNEVAISLSAFNTGKRFNANDLQLGFSPFKHFNISGSFYKEQIRYKNRLEGQQESYIVSIGSNYKIKRLRSNTDKTVISEKTKEEKGLNFIINMGYSRNRIKANRPKLNNASKDIKYNSFFGKLGLLHDYNWGNISFSGVLNFNIYKDISFTGDYFEDNDFEIISENFEKRNVYQIWNINFHNEMGKGMIKLLFGLNYILYDQFDNFDLENKSDIEKTQYYLGVLVNLNNRNNKEKKRIQKGLESNL